MKIVYIVETYTEGLGYIDNILPRELGRLGHEVHLLTCKLPVYYQQAASFFGDVGKNTASDVEIERHPDFTLHTCSYRKIASRVLIRDLSAKLLEISPDVVLVRGIASPVLGQAVLAKRRLGFKLVTSTGQAYSALPAALREGKWYSKAAITNFIAKTVPGMIFSTHVDKCVGSTEDCVDSVVDFYGVPRSITKVISLGTDTDLFYPVGDRSSIEERSATRRELGVSEDEILCIWTGRMSHTKSVHILAEAVEQLAASGTPYRALFIGTGPAEESLRGFSRSTVVPFKPHVELPRFYRAADIAVWPRSMTTSTLDASACGLPVVLSNQEKAKERWEEIGATYEENDVQSLMTVLVRLSDTELRNEIRMKASARMRACFSWQAIAKEFVKTFEECRRRQ